MFLYNTLKIPVPFGTGIFFIKAYLLYFFRPVNNRLSTGILADIFFNTMLVTSDTPSKIM